MLREIPPSLFEGEGIGDLSRTWDALFNAPRRTEQSGHVQDIQDALTENQVNYSHMHTHTHMQGNYYVHTMVILGI